MASILAVMFACVAAACGLYIWRTRASERGRSNARVAVLASAIDPARDDDAPSLFEQSPPRGAHPLMKIAAGFAVVASIIFVVAIVSDARERRVPDFFASPEIERAAIALVSMSHVRHGQTFVIHGLVRNEGRRRSSGLSAVVTVLDAAGHPGANGRAPIDDQSLAPGKTSRFDVRLDSVRAVARYRVSFEGPAGVVRHVDVRRRGVRDTQAAGPATPASTGF